MASGHHDARFVDDPGAPGWGARGGGSDSIHQSGAAGIAAQIYPAPGWAVGYPEQTRRNHRLTRLAVHNQTRETVLCPRAELADTLHTRLFGLLGRRRLAPGTGLLIRPSSGVHTWGMRFPIDIVALDRKYSIVGLWRDVGPWRVRGLSLRTASVLELAAGEIDMSESAIGDCLQMVPIAPGRSESSDSVRREV